MRFFKGKKFLLKICTLSQTESLENHVQLQVSILKLIS